MHTSHRSVVLMACELQRELRRVARTPEESILLGHLTTFIVTDSSTMQSKEKPNAQA